MIEITPDVFKIFSEFKTCRLIKIILAAGWDEPMYPIFVLNNKKMKTVLAVIAVAVILFFTCTGPGSGSEEQQSAKPLNTAVEKPLAAEDRPEPIETNNGAKWKVNPEMMVHVRNLENDVKAFSNSAQSAALADYKNLGGRIRANIDNITSTCTMSGKSHDELHKWLLPLIENTKGLQNAADLARAREYFVKIQASMDLFNWYFE